ncbi:hypothetical protein [Phenylobacterium sp.]|uniref:hypothetical protein n=1 Tax=Phenylobacterium sp. TaxID=1871053 RepID=UPI0025D7C3C7|nr:hypothetical protein [Phenylobacterium sp.]
MARTRRRLTPGDAAPAAVEATDPALPALLEKAHAVAAKVGRLQRDFAGAHRLAHQAQVREALTRTELTVALNETLAARAELEGRLREQALAGYQARGGAIRLRRHNRLSQALDKVLARLGPAGGRVVVARAGVGRVLFDPAWYLAANSDVAGSGVAPLVHYLVAGAREGRDPHPLFDAAWYARENAHELAATSLSGLEHYVRAGAARGRSPHPLFDVGHYLAQGPALADGEDPVSHYLREGARLGRAPHPLFDPAWYAAQAPEAGAAGGLLHYLTAGWRAGLTPHPLFDPRWYLAQHPEVAEAGQEPLTHFLAVGGFAGLSPSPWFDLPHYVAARGGGLAPGANPLVDYLQGGAWAVAEARPGFPGAAYLAARPDLVRAGLTPLEHWARRGGR